MALGEENCPCIPPAGGGEIGTCATGFTCTKYASSGDELGYFCLAPAKPVGAPCDNDGECQFCYATADADPYGCLDNGRHQENGGVAGGVMCVKSTEDSEDKICQCVNRFAPVSGTSYDVILKAQTFKCSEDSVCSYDPFGVGKAK